MCHFGEKRQPNKNSTWKNTLLLRIFKCNVSMLWKPWMKFCLPPLIRGGGRSLSSRDLRTFANKSAWLVITRGKWRLFYFHLVLLLLSGMCLAIYTHLSELQAELFGGVMCVLEKSAYSLLRILAAVFWNSCFLSMNVGSIMLWIGAVIVHHGSIAGLLFCKLKTSCSSAFYVYYVFQRSFPFPAGKHFLDFVVERG